MAIPVFEGLNCFPKNSKKSYKISLNFPKLSLNLSFKKDKIKIIKQKELIPPLFFKKFIDIFLLKS